MKDSVKENIDCQFGFKILELSRNLKYEFYKGGRNGRISFVRASILSGMQCPDRILEAAYKISGDWVRQAVETTIEEGENIHWGMDASGRLYVIED